MKIKITHEDVYIWGYIAFLCAFVISVSQLVISYPALDMARSVLRLFGYICCFYKIVNMKLSKRAIFIFTIFLFVTVIARWITGIDTLVVDFLLLASIQSVSSEKIIKLDLTIRVISFVMLYLSVLLQFVPDSLGYRNGTLVRRSLGFNHPNRLGVHLLMICLDIFYLKHKNFKAKNWFELIFLSWIMLSIADSRSPFFCSVILIAIEIIDKLLSKTSMRIDQHFVRILGNSILIASVAISIIIPYLFNFGRIFVMGDSDTLGSRIIKASYAIRTYGIHLFGSRIEVIGISEAIKLGVQANGIDNLYVYVLVNFGVVFFAAFILACFSTIKYLVNNENYAALICFLIVIIFSIVENPVLKIECNPFLIFVGKALLDNWHGFENARIKDNNGEFA